MTGKLAGIPYCPEAALAAAAAAAGAAEAASSSCPAKSQVGTAAVRPAPARRRSRSTGKVFLAGPYHGAPLSLAVVTPATAGPFDLGTVVVRVALFVDPETAQIRAVSDPIPRRLRRRPAQHPLGRPRTSTARNSPSTRPAATRSPPPARCNGGGADPANPAAFSCLPGQRPRSRPATATRWTSGRSWSPGCSAARRRRKRAGHPKFRAVLAAREGDANIAPRGADPAALRVPRPGPHRHDLHPGPARRQRLPGGARSTATRRRETPLLDDELAGPVYLVSSNHGLPDLLADLRGQVNVQLRGVISSAKARIKTVFYPVPDVPVSKFVLTMKGGKKGLLVNSRNLCAAPLFSFTQLQSPERQAAEEEEAAAADAGLRATAASTEARLKRRKG